MSGIVGNDEEARDDHGRKHPEGDDHEGIVEGNESGDDEAVHDEVSAEVGQALPCGVLVGLGGNDVENRLEGALFGSVRGLFGRFLLNLGGFSQCFSGRHVSSLPTSR